MVEPRIREEDVAHIISTRKEIESYPNDVPYPSRLVLGWIGTRPINVVAADTKREIIVITVYEPDPSQWQPSFEKRKP
jgi:hypothetical protein